MPQPPHTFNVRALLEMAQEEELSPSARILFLLVASDAAAGHEHTAISRSAGERLAGAKRRRLESAFDELDASSLVEVERRPKSATLLRAPWYTTYQDEHELGTPRTKMNSETLGTPRTKMDELGTPRTKMELGTPRTKLNPSRYVTYQDDHSMESPSGYTTYQDGDELGTPRTKMTAPHVRAPDSSSSSTYIPKEEEFARARDAREALDRYDAARVDDQLQTIDRIRKDLEGNEALDSYILESFEQMGRSITIKAAGGMAMMLVNKFDGDGSLIREYVLHRLIEHSSAHQKDEAVRSYILRDASSWLAKHRAAERTTRAIIDNGGDPVRPSDSSPLLPDFTPTQHQQTHKGDLGGRFNIAE